MKLTCFDKNNTPTSVSNETSCHFCHCDKNLTDQVYENETIKVCFLCRIIIANQKEDVYRCLLAHSKLSQLDIIKKTREYYEKHDSIPLPRMLDPDVKLANSTVYTFSKIEDKSAFKDIVVFFTSQVQDFMEDPVLAEFSTHSSKKTPILKYYG